MTRIMLLAAAGMCGMMPGLCAMSADGADPNAGGGGAATFDAKALAAKKVDDITPKLAELSRGDLEALVAFEKGSEGLKRSTLIEAIDSRIKTINAEAEADAAGEGDRGDMIPKTEHERIVAGLKAAHATEIAAAKAGDGKEPKPKPVKALALPKGAASPTFDQLTGMTKVVLVDEDDVPVPGAPTPEFAGAPDFKSMGGSLVLNRDIALDPGLPAGGVAGAFLLAGDKPIGRAQLVSPMGIGGGATVTLPAGSLAFGGTADQPEAAA